MNSILRNLKVQTDDKGYILLWPCGCVSVCTIHHACVCRSIHTYTSCAEISMRYCPTQGFTISFLVTLSLSGTRCRAAPYRLRQVTVPPVVVAIALLLCCCLVFFFGSCVFPSSRSCDDLQAIKETWASHCDGFVAFSDVDDREIHS